MNAQSPISAAVALNPLATSAMLSRLTVTQWTARKMDRKASEKVNADAGATRDAGRYHKALIAGEALSAITGAVAEARAFHYARTLPWLDDGARILPAGGYQGYSEGMHDIRLKFEAAVESFLSAYPEFVDASRARLGTMFDSEEYPTAHALRGRFTFGVRILPMPDAGDFRVNISEATAQAIRSDIESSTREALQGAMRDAWNRIVEQVGTMSAKLAAYTPAVGDTKATGIFRNSLVENVRELVEILPTFNLTGDAFLASTIERMRRELCTITPERLRDDAAAREDVAASAASILADVSAYLA